MPMTRRSPSASFKPNVVGGVTSTSTILTDNSVVDSGTSLLPEPPSIAAIWADIDRNVKEKIKKFKAGQSAAAARAEREKMAPPNVKRKKASSTRKKGGDTKRGADESSHVPPQSDEETVEMTEVERRRRWAKCRKDFGTRLDFSLLAPSNMDNTNTNAEPSVVEIKKKQLTMRDVFPKVKMPAGLLQPMESRTQTPRNSAFADNVELKVKRRKVSNENGQINKQTEREECEGTIIVEADQTHTNRTHFTTSTPLRQPQPQCRTPVDLSPVNQIIQMNHLMYTKKSKKVAEKSENMVSPSLPRSARDELSVSQKSTGSQESNANSNSSSSQNSQIVRPKRRSIFQKARMNASRKVQSQPTVERYVGNDVFGNYHMMKDEKVREILEQVRPDHELREGGIKKLTLTVNHWLEDFFVNLCEATDQIYGFVTFSQLKEALINQCLLPENASTETFLKSMKSLFSNRDWKRSEGILFPSRYSRREDTDDYFLKD